MTDGRKTWPAVHVTAVQFHDVVRLTWSVTKQWSNGDRPVRSKDRVVAVSYPVVLDVRQLTEMVGKMATYVLLTLRGARSLPKAIAWSEHPGHLVPVPLPGEGEGGGSDCPYCGRSADVQAAEQQLPSSCAPTGGGRGRERSELVSGSDAGPMVMPGQLELEGLDPA